MDQLVSKKDALVCADRWHRAQDAKGRRCPRCHSDVREIGVYTPLQASHTKPAFYASEAEAKNLRAQGLAFAIHRGRALRLIQAVPDPDVRDESCRMGCAVMEANAEGERWAAELVKGWKPQLAAVMVSA